MHSGSQGSLVKHIQRASRSERPNLKGLLPDERNTIRRVGPYNPQYSPSSQITTIGRFWAVENFLKFPEKGLKTFSWSSNIHFMPDRCFDTPPFLHPSLVL